MIKGILFDFAQTLIFYDDKKIYADFAHQKGVALETVRELTRSYFHKAHVGEVKDPEEFFRLTKPAGVITAEDVNSMVEKFLFTSRLDPNMLALVKRLKEEGYKLGLLTNFSSAYEKFIKKFPEVIGLFDETFPSYQLKMKKPDAKYFAYALEKLGLKPEEAVFIDDVPKYTEAARALGIHAITIQNPAQCIAELNHLLLNNPVSK